jgi:predicted transposase/invertase (TIGR01784 family)
MTVTRWKSLKVYRDWQNTIATAEHKTMERGLKQGVKEGKKEGELHKALEIAQQMKANGISLSVIAQCTGLDVNEIEQL